MPLYSQRIGSKTLMISDHPDNPDLVYKWTKGGGKTTTMEGGKQRYVCAGCRKVKDAKQGVGSNAKLPAMISLNGNWLDDGPIHPHFCEPFHFNQLCGEQERRKVQADLARGSRETVSAAKLRIDTRVANNYNDLPAEDRDEIRNIACGNQGATSQALYRAQVKRFANLRTLAELHEDRARHLWMTMRGRIAQPHSPHFEELLLRHLDDQLAIFASPRQMELLKQSRTIVSDGTFKIAPSGVYQIYRVFGFVEGQAFPLVTALMRGKTQQIYDRFWAHIRHELDNNTAGQLQWNQANFDFEPASVNAFRQSFPGVEVKMCVFHVQQALLKRIQRMGFADLYMSREPDGVTFQRLIRRIGALQFCPPGYVNRSIQLVQRLIMESALEIDVRVALTNILDYFIATWINNSLGPDFFSMFNVRRHRTTNHAESYHGRQRLVYAPHMLLGRWIVNFQEVNHSEEEMAMAIVEGRQHPNQPLAVTAEIDANIEHEKAIIIGFLDTEFDNEEFDHIMGNYFGRIGHLVGYNPPRAAELEEVLEEEAAQQEADASLDASGLSLELVDEVNEEERDIGVENIDPE